MTSAQATASAQRSAAVQTPAGSIQWRHVLSRVFVHGAVIFLIAVWILPTVGLLVSSFRHPTDIASTGWWTVFRTPLDLMILPSTSSKLPKATERTFWVPLHPLMPGDRGVHTAIIEALSAEVPADATTETP